jgi:hypothetical protein
MVCFDGSSSENNRIVFCDGCNASIHQICYGITEIPEGDYYCDRCRFVQKVIMTLEDSDLDMIDNGIYDGKMIKDTVRCCLCPLSHGGMKPTTDGRWVHLACALWACESSSSSNDIEILDMKDMSPIDISRLSFTSLKDNNSFNRSTSYNKRQQLLTASSSSSSLSAELQSSSASSSSCVYCNQVGGYLVNCSFHEKDDEMDTNDDDDWNSSTSCKRSFHPLCGWFSGCYMKSTITDDSFEGKERNGKYPSGIRYCFLCNNHSEHKRMNNLTNTTIQYQKTLRNKYRMNENDLEAIPGKNNRKKRKKNAKDKKGGGREGGGGRKTTSSSSQPKELAIDTYHENICACCLKPISNDLFGNGYHSEKFSEIQVLINDTLPDSSSSLALVHSDSDQIPFQLGSSSTSSLNPIAATSGNPVTYAVSNSIVSCSKCHIRLHKECLLEYHTFSYFDNESTWICDVCTEFEGNSFPPPASASASSLIEDGPYTFIHCALCPRRGGFLCHTIDDRWVHAFCSKNIPGALIRMNNDKQIDIRLPVISKENKKSKCFLCNRKGNGICISCNAVGCSTFFHPLCALRNGKGYIEIRNGIKEAYCYEHIPNGIEFLNGFWLNGNEIYRFRYCLDRARLVLDMLVRREKLKKTLCKTETDLFSSKIIKMLDKAKGRKSQRYRSGSTTAGDEGEEGGLIRYDSDEEGEEGGGEGEEDEEEEDDDDDSSIDEELFEEFVPLDYLYERKKKEKNKDESSSSSSSASTASSMKPLSLPMTSMTLSDGETTVDISNTWLNRHTKRLSDIKTMRKNMIIYFAGVDIKEKHSQLDRKAFLKHQKDFILTNEDKLRSRTGFFLSRNDEEAFANQLSSSLLKLMKYNEKEFKVQIGKIDEKLEIQFKKVHRKKEEEELSLSIIGSPSSHSKGKKKSTFFQGRKKGKRGRKRNSVSKKVGEGEGGGEGSDEEDEEDIDDDEEEGDDEDEEENLDDQPVKKKSKAATAMKEKEKEFENSSYYKQMISYFPSILDASSTINGDASSASDSVMKTKKRGRKPVAVIEEEEEENDKEMQEDDDENEEEEIAKEEEEEGGFDHYLQQFNFSQASSSSSSEEENHQINLMDWKLVNNEEELISLERLIFDILNCLSSYYINSYDDAVSHYPDRLLNVSLMEYIAQENGIKDRIAAAASSTNSGINSSFIMKTPVKQEEETTGKSGRKRRNSNNSSNIFLDEQEVIVKEEKGKASSSRSTAKVSPISSKHHKLSLSLALSSPTPAAIVSGKKGKKDTIVTSSVPEGRLLCEEFQDIPFPEYSNYVRRIMTFNMMRNKLHLHHYLSFASFATDFYLLLNNAKSVASPTSITWKDIKLLLKLFDESRIVFTSQSYSSMKGNFNSIRCSLLKKQNITVKKESSSLSSSSTVIPSTPTIATRKKFMGSSSSSSIKHDEADEDISKSIHKDKDNHFTCNSCKKKVCFVLILFSFCLFCLFVFFSMKCLIGLLV